MRHSLTFTWLSRYSSPAMAFFAASFLAFFGVANGLADQTVYALRLKKAPLVGNGWPALSGNSNLLYYFYIGERPSYLIAFPFLQSLKQINSGPPNYQVDFVPYGSYPLNAGGYVKYPVIYRPWGSITASTVPDTFSGDDLANLNNSYNSLPEAEKFALNGTFTFSETEVDGDSYPVFDFATNPVGSLTGTGGLYTYDSNGNVVQSFPDNTGYISGYTSQPDGSMTPVYYTIENNQAIVHDTIPVSDYSTLQYDSELSHYTLEVPNYSRQLDSIINKMDDIKSDVTVNPQILVNPSVTLEPEIILNPVLSVTNSVVLSAGVEDALYVATDVTPSNLSTNDLSLTQDEESAVSSLRSWETNIPLIGESIDFGLTTLLGRIPAIGTEYVWMDYTVGSNARSSSLPSFRIFISLDRYRDVILALRGFLILFEALLFLVMTYRNIREALTV